MPPTMRQCKLVLGSREVRQLSELAEGASGNCLSAYLFVLKGQSIIAQQFTAG